MTNITKNGLIIIGLVLGLSSCTTMKNAYNSAFGADEKANEVTSAEVTSGDSSGFSTSKNVGKMPESACQIAYKEAYLACVEQTKGKDQTLNDKLLNQCIKDKGFSSYDANCKLPAK